MSLALAVFIFLPLAAWPLNGAPSPVQCDDECAACRETCTLDHGTSARPAKRAKFKKCMERCQFRERDCREAVSQSLGNQPSGDPESTPAQPKEDDGPYRATSQDERDVVQRTLAEERRVEDERRAEEARRRAESLKAAEARKQGKAAEADRLEKAEKLRAEKAERDRQDRAAREEKAEREKKEAEKPAEKTARASDDDSSAPTKNEPREEPKATQKKTAAPPEEDAPADKKKPKKEQRALDEWDPDAL
jgi:hypothetical protein